jgi:hypothetical protein
MSQALSFFWPPGDICRALLRAIGLEILAASLPISKDPSKRLSKTQNEGEGAKVILRHDVLIALSRCAVHILPITVLIGLIWINYSNLYIGPTFVVDPKMDTIFLAGIQLAAKVQELLCVASLTTVVLQALRTELLSEGIPLGLLGCGIWYSSLSSFWSPEFWGALHWSCTGYKRARFLLLLVLAGGTATVIGPASAVLMLPRSQNIPAGGTSFYLDGTGDQYWPDTVTASSEPEFCAFLNATNYAICPSGGYGSLKRNLKTIDYAFPCPRTGQNFAPECQAKGAEGNRKWNNFLIQSPLNMVPPVLNSFQLLDEYERTAALQPHAATIIKMQQAVREWNTAASASKRRSLRQFQWTYDLETLGFTTSPWVRVKCTDAQNLSASATDAQFPYVYWRDKSFPVPVYRNSTGFSGDARYGNISRLDRTASSRLRTQWVSLSKDRFGDVHSNQTISGLLIEMPWVDGSRVALGCSVAASWHKSLLRSVRSTSYGAWSVALSSYDYGNYGDSPDSVNSNQPVELDESWLKLLSAPSPRRENNATEWNILEDLLIDTGIAGVTEDYRGRPQPIWSRSTSRCEYAMMATSSTDTDLWNDSTCNKGDKRYFIEMLLASMVVDGLSRYGSHRAYEMHPDTRDWQLRTLHTYNSSRLLSGLGTFKGFPNEVPSAWLEVFVNGYAYYPSSRSDFLALAVVCLYIVIAGSHVIATLLLPQHRVTSSTWETLTELLVLCQNSPPPIAGQLRNASAGIQRQRTYATIVKVRAVKVGESGDETCPNAPDVQSNEELYGGKVILVVEGAGPHATESGEAASELTDPMRSGSCWDGSSELALLDTDGQMSVSSRLSHDGLRQRISASGGTLEEVQRDLNYS